MGAEEPRVRELNEVARYGGAPTSFKVVEPLRTASPCLLSVIWKPGGSGQDQRALALQCEEGAPARRQLGSGVGQPRPARTIARRWSLSGERCKGPTWKSRTATTSSHPPRLPTSWRLNPSSSSSSTKMTAAEDAGAQAPSL